MKKLQLFMLIIMVVSNCNAQIIGVNTEDKMYLSWKQSKLYVVKTENEAINSKLEALVKTSFPNFVSSVSQEEAEKLMDNENNFIVMAYFAGPMKTKLNTWDKFNFGIGIFQCKAKKFEKIDLGKFILRYDYLPVAPNMNLSLVISAARKAYTDTGLDKTFKAEPNILTMLPSTIIGFKQTLDALDKTADKKMIDVYKGVAKINRANASILKNKTLLILNHEIIEPFYEAYKLKKEKVEINDLRKLEAKDKNYCFLMYTIEPGTSIRQVTVIDCETGKIIYQDSGLTATTGDKMKPKYADNMHMAIDGKSWD